MVVVVVVILSNLNELILKNTDTQDSKLVKLIEEMAQPHLQ